MWHLRDLNDRHPQYLRRQHSGACGLGKQPCFQDVAIPAGDVRSDRHAALRRRRAWRRVSEAR
eukprot:366322-Chlamydomonas_euryale.AAC.14